jgi:hypothetical protein
MKKPQQAQQSTTNNLLMRSIKMIDIGFLTIIYTFFAFFFAKITDKTLGPFNSKAESEKPKWKITIELFILIWIFGLLMYFVRNVVILIPFPLDGFQGFSHIKVKELHIPIIFSFLYLLVGEHFRSKILYYYNNII